MSMGALTASTFAGNGASITALNASNITSGTLPNARLSSNVVMDTGAQTIAGLKTFSSSPIIPTPT